MNFDSQNNSAEQAIDDAIRVIDAELARLVPRDVIAASEMTDVLLDLRLVLAPVASKNNEATEQTPVGV